MTWLKLNSVDMLHLLWLLPALAAVFIYAAVKRKQALERFAETGLIERLNRSVSRARRRWKAALVVLAAGFVVLALARPAWNPKPKEIKRRGRDVVFVLDVSRSMLAEDLAPNRLERAKLAIADTVNVLEGDRVALVAFAGTAAVKCPLTLDYGFFKMMLDRVDTRSIARGGTMMGDALRTVLSDVFDDREKRFKDVVLITDGEDHDSFPVEAAREAGEKGIRLIAIGLGDEDQGKRIPITDASGRRTFLTHDGREIWSRLDADTLRKMVNATQGGKYLNVSTGTIDLGQVYRDLVASAEKQELESKTVRRYEEKFQVFIALAFILAAIECIIGQRRKTPAGELS